MRNAYLSSENTGAPLSGAVEAHGLVFVSGQIHMREGTLVGKTIEEKLEVTMENIQHVLAQAGLTLDNVIKVEIFLTDIKELSALNKAYPAYWQHPYPARTSIGVKALPLGASLEIAVVASRI